MIAAAQTVHALDLGTLIPVIIAVVVAPVLLNWLSSRSLAKQAARAAVVRAQERAADAKTRAEEKQADWDRQDDVAKAAAQAADDLAASQLVIAEKAAEAATLLQESNKRIADKLATSTAVTASRLTELADGQKVIHTLVNSNMTESKERELSATERELAMMKEVVDLKRTAGHEPTSDVLRAISATEAVIAALKADLADRQHQQGLVDDDAKLASAAAAMTEEGE